MKQKLHYLIGVLCYVINKKPERISLINDDLPCRYGYCKYPFVKNKGEFPRFIRNGSYGIPAEHDDYDSRKYFLFPFPKWLNKSYWNNTW